MISLNRNAIKELLYKIPPLLSVECINPLAYLNKVAYYIGKAGRELIKAVVNDVEVTRGSIFARRIQTNFHCKIDYLKTKPYNRVLSVHKKAQRLK